jgi:hypothetical protein
MTVSLKLLPVMLLMLVQPFPFFIQTYIQFNQSDSSKSYVQIPDNADLSVSTTGSLTVAAWMRPDTLDFKYTEGNGYVNWLGKGDTSGAGRDEWQFRVYNSSNSQNRVNRISFYVFNLTGGEGIGSYFQYSINTPDPVRAGEWIFVVGVVDGTTNTTSIYKNGVFVRCDKYYGDAVGHVQGTACQHYPRYNQLGKTTWVVPKHGSAPLFMGRSDSCCPTSYFQGAISKMRIWNRVLNSTEIQNLYHSDAVPQEGLVAQYLLDENSGNVVHDNVRGHDGDVVGTSWMWITSSPAAAQTTQTSSTLANTIGLVVGIPVVVAVIVALTVILRRRFR